MILCYITATAVFFLCSLLWFCENVGLYYIYILLLLREATTFFPLARITTKLLCKKRDSQAVLLSSTIGISCVLFMSSILSIHVQ